MFVGGIVIAAVAVLLGVIAGLLFCYANDKSNDDPGSAGVLGIILLVVAVGCVAGSVSMISDSREGHPIWYTDSNGLTTGEYVVIATFEDNGRPYLAAVKIGENEVKVFALQNALPPHTKKIKVDRNKTGPERITVDNLAEERGKE